LLRGFFPGTPVFLPPQKPDAASYLNIIIYLFNVAPSITACNGTFIISAFIEFIIRRSGKIKP